MKGKTIFFFIAGTIFGYLLGYGIRLAVSAKSQPVQTEEPIPLLVPTPSVTETATPTVVLTVSSTPAAIPMDIPVPTPTLTPTATPEVVAPADLEPLFDELAGVYRVDKNKLKAIADCESRFTQGALVGPYAGMYQFTESTWEKYRRQMGKDPNVNLRFGARESIETAAYVLSIGDEHIWPACLK